MKPLRKLTVRTVYDRDERLQKFEADDAIGAERLIMTVYGRADSAQLDEKPDAISGDINQYIRFRGDFAAYRGEIGAGEQLRSTVMVLPAVAAKLLADLLKQEGEGGELSANFGFRLSIRKTETPIGYEFAAATLIEQRAEAFDPLDAVAEQIKGLRGAGEVYDAVYAPGAA